MTTDRTTLRLLLVAAVTATAAFALGRASVSDGLLRRAAVRTPTAATFSGGALGADDVRAALAGAEDAGQRRAAVEQVVRTRLLAQAGEAAELHLTPEFLQRYAEELARAYLEKAFEEPFQKSLPTEAEIRKFFDDNRAKLGRPERVRLAHVALLAPRADGEARARKQADAERLLAKLRHGAGRVSKRAGLARDRAEHGTRVQRQQVQDERIGVLRLDVVRRERCRGEVAEIRRDDDLRAGADRGGEHVPVLLVRKRQASRKRLTLRDASVRDRLLHQLAGAIELAFEIRPGGDDVLEALVEDAVCPARLEQAGPREPDEQVADGRRV